MKGFLKKAAAAAGIVLAGMVAQAAAAERIIVLAPDYTEKEATQIAEGNRKILKALKPGDRFKAVVAGSGATILDATVPSDPIYARHPKLMEKLVAPHLMRLHEYLRDAIKEGEARDPATPASRINIPDTLAALAYDAKNRPAIALFGNPIYHDVRHPQLSMSAAYPLDGHLSLTRAQSAFGAAGAEKQLDGIQMHVCVTSARWMNLAHEEGSLRFYSLLASAMGAQIATWGEDIPGCSKRFVEGDASGARTFTRNVEDKRSAMVDTDPAKSLPVELVAAITNGTAKLQSLFLYDAGEEDGDEVEIVGPGGFSRFVALKHRQQEVRVPVVQGALHVVGKRDGRGGITVAIRTATGQVILSQRMAVGERIAIPIPAQ